MVSESLSSGQIPESAVVGTGVPAISKETVSKTKTLWFKHRYVLYAAILLTIAGVGGVVASLIFGMGKGGFSGSNNSASNPAPSAPGTSLISPTTPPVAQGTATTPFSSSPTQIPTLVPTSTPSLFPSATPSLRPSSAPSKQATPNPTVEPTVGPTEEPTVEPTPQPTATAFDQFSFYVMGDIPYAEWQEEVLAEQLAEMTATRPQRSSFTVHVGDLMQADRSKCQESYFLKVYNILLQGPLPTFVLQGDNDSTDCEDPEQAYKFFLKYFAGDPNVEFNKPFETHWSGFRLPDDALKLDVTRWTDRRPEFFSFVTQRILFLSTGIMNGDPEDEVEMLEFNNRMRDSIEWVTTNINKAFLENPLLRGVVLFGHAERRSEMRPFFEAILPLFVPARLNIPFLYLHGDGHTFDIDTRFSEQTGWTLFRDVQVDQGAKADPLLVEVAPFLNGVTFPLKKLTDSQYLFGNGLFRIDRQRGQYS